VRNSAGTSGSTGSESQLRRRRLGDRQSSAEIASAHTARTERTALSKDQTAARRTCTGLASLDDDSAGCGCRPRHATTWTDTLSR